MAKILTIALVFLCALYCAKPATSNSIRIDSLKRELTKYSDEDTSKLSILSKLAFAHYSIDPEKGIEYGNQGIKLSIKLNNNKYLAKCYNNVGVCYWTQAQNTIALDYIFKALRINEANNFKDDIYKIYNNIGLIYISQGDYEEALINVQKSLQLNLKINDKKVLIHNYSNLGIIYLHNNDVTKSINYFQKSIEICNSLNNTESLAFNYSHLGDCYTHLKNYGVALSYYEKSMVLTKQLNNRLLEAMQIERIGALYNLILVDSTNINSGRKKDYIKKVIAISNEGIKISKSQNYKWQLLAIYKNLYDLYRTNNDYKLATEYVDKFINLQKEIENTELTIYNQKLKQQRKHDSALNEIKSLKEKEEDARIILTISFSSAILFLILMLAIFHYYKKVKNMNAHLKDQNSIIKDSALELEILNRDLTQRELELNKVNASKDKFFSILAHDLRNPIGSYYNLTNLMCEKYESFTDSEILRNLNILSLSSKNVFDLLENLLNWSRTQSGSIDFEPMVVNVNDLIAKVIKALDFIAHSKSIRIKSKIETDVLAFCDSNMIMTIVRNLITNSIKFTNPNGRIIVSSLSNDDYHTICVEDDGVGMEEVTLTKLFNIESGFTMPGTNREKGSGLGLILCQEFVKLHNGKIWAESEYGSGSKFYFTLPKDKYKIN